MATVKQRLFIYIVLVTVSFLVGFFWPSTPPPPPNQIPWNSNHLLEWDDFQGTPVASVPFSAHTGRFFGTNYNIRVFETEEGCYFTITDITTEAYVDRSSSWVKQGFQSQELLSHEQGHANILYIHALQYNVKKLSLIGKYTPCGDDPNATARQMVNSVFNPIHDAMERMQHEYDTQTNHGQNTQEQYNWNRKISDILMPPAPSVLLP